MINVDLIKAGDELWDCHKVRMGNTTTSTTRCWPVKIISIDHARGMAVVSWNGNRNENYWRNDLRRLRRSPIKGCG